MWTLFSYTKKDKEVNTNLSLFALTTRNQTDELLNNQYLDKYNQKSGFRGTICLKTDNIPIGYVNVSENEGHDF